MHAYFFLLSHRHVSRDGENLKARHCQYVLLALILWPDEDNGTLLPICSCTAFLGEKHELKGNVTGQTIAPIILQHSRIIYMNLLIPLFHLFILE